MKNNQQTENSLPSNNHSTLSEQQLLILSKKIKEWGKALGFQHLGISEINLLDQEANLQKLHNEDLLKPS